MRIGLLFGSFDPPHQAHVDIAEHMLTSAGLDQVWLVVTPANPFKLDRKLSPENHRLAMTRLALLGNEKLQASGVEMGLPKPSYTVDSLKFIRMRWPEDEFLLIIGSDNLSSFHAWKDPEEILKHHKLLVYPRPGHEDHLRSAELKDHPSVTIMENAPLMDISSTAIRDAIKNWRPVNGLVAPQVLSYIHQHRLYQ